ncbi:DUF2911 domain-containing protein [Sanyastnella coralliicola]|uniref:DUF2911 domain-containing protein n=1 Tax=Sanyastnella coralliicola TaxID=3069118 RepID=UPI0027BADB4A|nr:DUF2911 domain-containing protein [Longitalea sp. SCSIO 12813]
MTYGSPAVNGREIWGGLEEFDEVWRAGANNATTIEFSHEVEIEGQTLSPGKYALFIVPKEGREWEIIFSNNPDQWGAFSYNPEEDALRIKANLITLDRRAERLTYHIGQEAFDIGFLMMAWDRLGVRFTFKTRHVDNFKTHVTSRLAETDSSLHWIVYLQAAEHLIDHNIALDQAQDWINTSATLSNKVTDWNPHFYPEEYVKHHLLFTAARLTSVEDPKEALEMAQPIFDSMFYERNKDWVDELMGEWDRRMNAPLKD